MDVCLDLCTQRHIGCAPSLSLSLAPLPAQVVNNSQRNVRKTLPATATASRVESSRSLFLFTKKSFPYSLSDFLWCVAYYSWLGCQVQIKRREEGKKHTHTLFRPRWLNFASLKLIVCFFFFLFHPYGKKSPSLVATYVHTRELFCNWIWFPSISNYLWSRRRLVGPSQVGRSVGWSGVIVAWLNSASLSLSSRPFVSSFLFSRLFSIVLHLVRSHSIRNADTKFIIKRINNKRENWVLIVKKEKEQNVKARDSTRVQMLEKKRRGGGEQRWHFNCKA